MNSPTDYLTNYEIITLPKRTRGLLWAAKNELQTYSQEGYQHDPVGNPVSKLAAQIISVLAEERILFSS